MLLVFSALLAVAVIVALSWLMLPVVGATNQKPHLLDFASFQNLVRPDDDLFLKKTLSKHEYHIAKRLRTRAIQEYLLWIVHDCMALQSIVRSSTEIAQDQTEAETLITMAALVRMLSLRLWAELWLQWLFPSLNIRPGSILDAYENFLAVRQQNAACTLKT